MTQHNPTRMCSTTDVRKYFDYVGRLVNGGTTVQEEIDWQENLIYDEYGDPLVQIKTYLNDDFSSYYSGQRHIYRVDRVSYGTASKITLEEGTSYTWNATTGFIQLATSATSSVGTSIDDTKWLEVEYVPRMYNRLCALKTAEALIEDTDTSTGNKPSKELMVVNKRLKRIERVMQDKVTPVLSGDCENYDEVYGVNRKIILQKHSKNKQMARES